MTSAPAFRVTADCLLQANPDLVPVPGVENGVCFANLPARELEITDDVRTLLDAWDTPQPPSEILPDLDDDLLSSLQELYDAGLLVSVESGRAVQPSFFRRAHDEFTGGFDIHDGLRVEPRELVERIGLPTPLPPLLADRLALGKALGHDAVVGQLLAQQLQWNPYCGQYYIALPGGGAHDPRVDARWLGNRRQYSVNTAYKVVHELVHAQIACVALNGLLKTLSLDELAAYHVMSEGIAVIEGDIELSEAFDDVKYIERYWPAMAHQAHANPVHPARALASAGVAGRPARAALMLDVYGLRATDLPHVPDDPVTRAELFLFLSTEQDYARAATREVNPSWNANYWGSPDLERFRRSFVPDVPISVETDRGPVCIGTFQELQTHWMSLLDGTAARHWEQPRNRARLEVQRLAMKVAELLRAARSPRLHATESQRDSLLKRLEQEWSELESRFLAAIDPNVAEASMGALRVEAQARRETLIRELRELSGAEHWSFAHPLLRGELMHPITTRLEKGRLFPGLGESATAVISFVMQEAMAYLSLVGDDEPTLALLAKASQLNARITASRGRGSLEAEIDAWLTELEAGDALKLAYPLAWASTHTFVDPAVGFRFQ